MQPRRGQTAGISLLTPGLWVTVFLVVGGGLVTRVHSVVYSGDTTVKLLQPWNITCSKILPDEVEKVQWKRNGQDLSVDLAKGIMHVEPAVREPGNTFATTLVSTTTLDRHEGRYTCLDNANSSHTLSILYDVQLKVLSKTDGSVVLDCPEGMSGTWLKDDEPLKEMKFVRKENNGSLIVTFEQLTDSETYGNYSCTIGNVTASYRVVRKPTVHLPPATNVVEGEKMNLICNVMTGDPGLRIAWRYNNVTYYGSNDQFELRKDDEKNVMNANLYIEKAEMSHRGNFTCIGYYNADDFAPGHFHESTTFVRVKDKLAALWPFLGIVAEVVVLCAIILIYEKKRNKSELEESDTDQSPDTKPSATNKDSADVRQRK